jgi:hypothetical protein
VSHPGRRPFTVEGTLTPARAAGQTPPADVASQGAPDRPAAGLAETGGDSLTPYLAGGGRRSAGAG